MNAKRQVFYSFHYGNDVWRTFQVRNIGVVNGSKPVNANDWEKIKKGGNIGIKYWIAGQMKNRSCTVVLVGEKTAGRKWIEHEIIESWNKKKGVVGIYIHGLKDENGAAFKKGKNPFDDMIIDDKKKLSSIVKCYDPTKLSRKDSYAWIENNLSKIIEEAIDIRKNIKKYI